MRREPVVGILPLYLELYDAAFPDLRSELLPLVDTVEEGLRREGVRTVRADVSRLEAECAEAVRRLEAADVDLIVTLHLAYSPSGEAAGPLAAARAPVLLLDTTPDFEFGPDVDPARILRDHGIHGVQDLACVLRRRGKPYEVVAGHAIRSDAIRRAAETARAALAARVLRETRALRIGGPFAGMGDFHVEAALLRGSLGITVDDAGPEALAPFAEAVTEEEIAEEMRADRERFDADLDEAVHRRSVRLGLGLRRLLEEGRYGAFSANFAAFDAGEGPVDTVPFLEASKAMARGVGYAGEGDVLTASLVGALGRAFGRTTFTEIFCPDWSGGSLFLSHMGEINPEVAARRPRLCEKAFPWTGARNPATIACAPAPGPAVLVNLAPGPGEAPGEAPREARGEAPGEASFGLIIAPVTVLGDATNPAMRDAVRAWVRPALPLERFLERYSILGGTHHSALVLGDRVEGIAAFARLAGIPATILGG